MLVLCTGADYGEPWKSSDPEKTKSERASDFKNLRQKIAENNSVLVIGGGLTGLETAGYLAEKGKIKVGICQRNSKLLPSVNKAHEKLKNHLENLKINLHLETNFEGKSTLDALGYKMSIDCRGYRFTTPARYLSGDLAQCLHAETGQILINSYGQLTTNLEPAKTWSNIFAFGDVCHFRENEVKSIVSMY